MFFKRRGGVELISIINW